MITSLKVSNQRFILISAVIAAISLTYGILNFNRAFPEIAINFQAPREAALDSAKVFLKSRNIEVDDYKNVIIFQSGGIDRRYLEKELGVERLTSLARDTINVWSWRARFFKPLQKLEYRVWIDTKGRVVEYHRFLPESEPGPSLEQSTAKILAEEYLKNQMNIDLGLWEHVESEAIERPSRKDHLFIYELKNFKAGDANYRLMVGLQGAEVSLFYKYLDVPQEWKRKYKRQRSQNDLFQNIASFLSFLTIVFVFIFFFRHIRNRQIPWKAALILGTVLAAVKLVMTVNGLPNSLAGYPTTDSFGAFIGRRLFFGLMNGILEGMLIILLVGAGEYLYRKDFPRKLALQNIFSRRGFKTSEFIQATVMGYILVAFDIGFVVFYYIFGKKFGFWTPADVKYTNAVSTWAPWIYPLAISMGASMLEEFWYRLFGISFFKKVFKSTVLAVIIPAFIWGFLHSAYPQEPGFARGIEVGLIGILAGIVMLRFGIWATLVWHFVLDAILIGLFLFQSDSVYFWVSGLIVCGALLIPAAVAGIVYWKRKSFETTEDLVNEAVESPPSFRMFAGKFGRFGRKGEKGLEAVSQAVVLIKTAISPRTMKLATILGLAGFLISFIPITGKYGSDFSLKVDRQNAIETASRAASEKYGINPADYRISAITSVDYYHKKTYSEQNHYSKLSYVKKYGTKEDAERIFLDKEGVSEYYWKVSFRKEFDAEEFEVGIGFFGEAPVINHILPDSLKGAELEADSALVLGERAFQEAEDLSDSYHLVSQSSQQHERRRDHYFQWETKETVLEEAYFRQGVSVKGDEVNVSARWLKVPEEWKRQEKKRTLRSVILQASGIILIILLFLYGMFSLGKRLIRREVKWRAGIIAGGVTMALAIINSLNEWQSWWWDYKTSEPVANFLTSQILEAGLELIFRAAFVFMIVSLAETMIRGRYETGPWFKFGEPKVNVKNDLSMVIGVFGVYCGLSWLIQVATIKFRLPEHSFSIKLPETLSSHFPWSGDLSTTIMGAILFSSLISISFIMVTTITNRTWLRWGLLAAGAVSISGIGILDIGNATTPELVWHATKLFGYFAIGYLIMKHWIQGRLWVLFLSLIVIKFWQSASLYLGWQDSPYQAQGWILVFFAALPVIFLLFRLIKSVETGEKNALS